VAPVLNLHAGGKVIRTTAEHPFFVWLRGWVRAGDLRRGDWLVGHDGKFTLVEAVTDGGEVTTVYNLRVAEYHTYFVGCPEWRFSVWAHNVYNPEGLSTEERAEIVESAKALERGEPSKHVDWEGQPVLEKLAQTQVLLPEYTLAPSFHETLEAAWSRSFRPDGTVAEQGGSIIRQADVKVDYRDGPDGLAGAYSNENYPVPDSVRGEELVGRYHTHPYANGPEGIPHSAEGIYVLGQGYNGPMTVVKAGGATYVLRIEDEVQALWTTRNQKELSLKFMDALRNATGSIQDQYVQAVLATVEGRGMRLYRGV
jgi:hypothetical protein